MRNRLRLSILYLCVISSSVILTSNALAENGSLSHFRHCEGAYEDGYDDGYEDAMEDCPCPPLLYKMAVLTAFYVGGALGYESFNAKQKIFLNDTWIANIHNNSSGFYGNIFGGYGKYFPNQFYVAGEAFLGTGGANNSSSINSQNSTDKVSFKTGTSYGLSVLPGYKLSTGPLLYGRLGYINTDLKVSESSTGAIMTSSRYSHWTSGFEYGLGILAYLCKNFYMRMEVDHIDYNSFTNPQTQTKTSPSDNQASLGLLYNIPLRF